MIDPQEFRHRFETLTADDLRGNPVDVLAKVVAGDPDYSPELLGHYAALLEAPVCGKCGADFGWCAHSRHEGARA